MKQHRIMTCVAAILSMTFVGGRVEAADGLVMQDGKMMMITDGQVTGPLNHVLTTHDGLTVTPDGTMKTKDGRATRVPEGQMMTMDGKLMEPGQVDARRKHVIGAQGATGGNGSAGSNRAAGGNGSAGTTGGGGMKAGGSNR